MFSRCQLALLFIVMASTAALETNAAEPATAKRIFGRYHSGNAAMNGSAPQMTRQTMAATSKPCWIRHIIAGNLSRPPTNHV
jgi:hypothetical protein